MSGHVFHPGHEELHGVTVVVDAGATLWVGRYHAATPTGILLHDAGAYQDGKSEGTREEFLRRTLKFGVRVEQKDVLVAQGEVRELRRLMDATATPAPPPRR